MPAEIGKAFLGIEPSLGGFEAKVKGALAADTAEGGIFSKLGKKSGLLFGAGLTGALAVGAGLFAVGDKFEGLFNKIRVQTGATGKTFGKLRDDAKNVLAGTAGTFDQVSAAIGGLYTRTGLTGKGLDDLAKKEVTLGRITKTDVGTNVEQTTSLFNRFHVATRDQSKELDVLFKASQAGGKGIGELISTMQTGAPALTAFGFGFDKSAALVASLERAGVNVMPVLTGLRTGFGKIAKEGGDPQKVLAATFRALQDGKNPTLATANAIKLFGARGGKELSDAVRSGRFDVDGLLKTITNGKDGITATGTAVSTIGGKFARLKNMALVALEPIGTKLVDLANVGMAKVLGAFTAAGPIVGKAFGAIKAGFSGAVAGKGADGITRVFTAIGSGARGLVNALKPIAATIGQVFDQVVAAVKGFDFGQFFNSAKAAVGQLATAIKGVDFAGIFGKLATIVTPIIGPLRQLGTSVVQLAVAAFPVLMHAVNNLKPVFIGLVASAYVIARVAGVVLAVAIKGLAAAMGLLSRHASILRPVLIGVGGAFAAFKIVKTVQAGILGVANAAGKAYGTVQRLASQTAKYASTLKSGISSVASFGKSVLTSAINIGKQVAAFVAQKAAAVASAIATKALAAGQWLLNAAMDANPIGLIVVGIAALAAGFVLAYQHITPFRNAIDALGRAFLAAFNWVKSNWPKLLLILTGPFGVAVLLIKGHFSQITGFASHAFGKIGGFAKAGFHAVTGAISSAFNWVKSHWPLLLAILTGPIGIAVLAISKNWDTIKTDVGNVFGAVKHAFNNVVSFVRGVPGRISSVASGMWDGIKTAFKDAINFVIDGWNSLQFKLPSFKGLSLGGHTIIPGFTGPTLGVPQIPRLATGAVITAPTLALLGETRAARPEIAAPAPLLRSIFRSELTRIHPNTISPARIAHDAITTRGGDNAEPIDAHIEAHFHGGDVPTSAELELLGRRQQFKLVNTGRRP